MTEIEICFTNVYERKPPNSRIVGIASDQTEVEKLRAITQRPYDIVYAHERWADDGWVSFGLDVPPPRAFEFWLCRVEKFGKRFIATPIRFLYYVLTAEERLHRKLVQKVRLTIEEIQGATNIS